jgi:hypothetical protein
MATNLNVAASIYASRVIKTLPDIVKKISVFSTDYSDEAKQIGETITVDLAVADSVKEWNDTTANYAGTEGSKQSVEVKLDGRKIINFAITPKQMAHFRPEWWMGKADLNMRALALAFSQSITAKVTAANFSKNITVTPASFGLEMLADIRAKCAELKIEPEMATLNLNSTLYSYLLSKLDSTTYGGREAIQNGIIQGVLGFANVVEHPSLTIPGFVNMPSALAFATRVYMPVDTTPYRTFAPIVEPASGITMSSVVYTEGNTGKTSYSNDIVFGSSVGDKDALIRLTNGTK